MPRGTVTAIREVAEDVPTVGQILRQRSAWFTAFGLFGANYYWYFLIAWLPAYLEKERHFPKQKMAIFGWLPFIAIAISCVVSGWLSDRLIARGNSPTKVRKAFAGTGLTLATVIVPVALVKDAAAAMTLLILACLSIEARVLFFGPEKPVETRKLYFYMVALTCIVLAGGWLLGVLL